MIVPQSVPGRKRVDSIRATGIDVGTPRLERVPVT